MIRTLSFLFLILFFASCGKGGGGGSDEQQLVSDSESVELDAGTPAPTLAQTFDIKTSMTGFSKTNRDKVLDAIEVIKKIVASDEFKTRVLNHKYNGKKTFVNNNGLTNSQIYSKILRGAEVLTPAKNNRMDLVLETYYTEANVIGYTMANIKTIYMNRRYLSTFETNKVAMNLFHEWLHKVGFGHDSEATARRPYSVPYAIGYIVRDLAAKH